MSSILSLCTLREKFNGFLPKYHLHLSQSLILSILFVATMNGLLFSHILELVIITIYIMIFPLFTMELYYILLFLVQCLCDFFHDLQRILSSFPIVLSLTPFSFLNTLARYFKATLDCSDDSWYVANSNRR